MESRQSDPPTPGTLSDITLPIWRTGEVLLPARSLANAMVEGPASIAYKVHYEGLAGRSLTSLSGNQLIMEGYVARQGQITLASTMEAASIESNLPEIIGPLLEPMYGLFDFFQLPAGLVSRQLAEMRGQRF